MVQGHVKSVPLSIQISHSLNVKLSPSLQTLSILLAQSSQEHPGAWFFALVGKAVPDQALSTLPPCPAQVTSHSQLQGPWQACA